MTVLTPGDFDTFVGHDKARDEHAERIRKTLADAGLPRPNPDVEDYGGDEVMARLGQWLGLYDGVVRRRELVETGNATAEDLSEMMWRLERMGEIRGELVWRYGVADWETGVVPDEAVESLRKVHAGRLKGADARSAANAEKKADADQWKRQAQAEANEIWERHPDWKISPVAERVRKNLKWDRSANTIRQAIKKPDKA